MSDQTLKENLSRLSNLMNQKKKNKEETAKENPQQITKKTIFMNLKSFAKPFAKKLEASNSCKIVEAASTQSQTPKTITKQQMYRPQSMALFKQIFEFKESKQSDTSIKQDLSQYKDWVGLSVINRNEIFLRKKQQKIKHLLEEKEKEILSACTFTPKLSQQIKYPSPKSQILGKSYLDLHNLKKTYNEKLY